jgi:F-type H+-transporting ATPase subunit epsilon
MKLKIFLPARLLLDIEPVDKVTAEAENGAFGLLPHHIDFVTVLVPGILSYTVGGREYFAAADEGILTKAGPLVAVSTRNAVLGDALGDLRTTVEAQFRTLSENERKTRTALARWETVFVRRLAELRK